MSFNDVNLQNVLINYKLGLRDLLKIYNIISKSNENKFKTIFNEKMEKYNESLVQSFSNENVNSNELDIILEDIIKKNNL